MAKKINRKDSKNRVLRQGEYARADGGYEYRWTDKNGQRHSRYRKNLADLRELEDQIYSRSRRTSTFTITTSTFSLPLAVAV